MANRALYRCSFFRLFLRWLPQWTYLTPKPENIIFLLPNYQVSAIIGPNLLCMLLHIVTSLPQASEASRGYLHGGVLVDFVGQKPPASKFTLLLLDLILLGLQCFMMSVNMERDKVRKIIKPSRSTTGSGGGRERASTQPTSNQDHDAEERGVHRDAPTAGQTEDSTTGTYAMGDLEGLEERTEGEGEGIVPRSAEARRNSSYEELGDVLNSGNATLAEFHVRDALRTAWGDRLNTPESGAAFALQVSTSHLGWSLAASEASCSYLLPCPEANLSLSRTWVTMLLLQPWQRKETRGGPLLEPPVHDYSCNSIEINDQLPAKVCGYYYQLFTLLFVQHCPHLSPSPRL